MRRTIILGLILALDIGMFGLTVKDIVKYGITPLTVVGIVILAFVTPIIVGLLRAPPPGDD